MSIHEILHGTLLPKLDGVKNQGGYFVARCPAHEDHEPSLSITPGKKHPIVLQCHAGCQTEDILAALNLTWDDISLPREEPKEEGEWTPAGPASHVYDYRDEHGTLLFQVLRVPQPGVSKTFRQRVPDAAAKGGWRWSLGDAKRVIYRLPEIIKAIDAGEIIYVCEGEKDVDSLVRHGVSATCNPGGAGKWRDEYSDLFVDAHIKIIADRDKPGQAHARQVADQLAEIAGSVTILEPTAGKDITEHFGKGKTLDDLMVTWMSVQEAAVDLAPDLHEFLAVEDPPTNWVVPGLLERGDRLIWTGFEGLGKALALDTPIPTPKGWTTMGALSVGDEVFSSDGTPVRVVAATDVMTDRPCYRVRFSDGAEVVADARHLWLTETLKARESAARAVRRPAATKKSGTDQRHLRRHFPTVVDTQTIAETLHGRAGHALNHSVTCCEPLRYPTQEQPVDPYVLGAWLGDGSSRTAQITCADPEILDEIRAAGFSVHKLTSGPYLWAISKREEISAARKRAEELVRQGTSAREACRQVGLRDGTRIDGTRPAGWRKAPGSKPVPLIRRLTTDLRRLGVLENKHVPEIYLHADVDQRLGLLQGLMDTDGTVCDASGTGRGTGAAMCEFSVCSEPLARGVHELLLGLGIKVKWHEGPAVLEGRTVGVRYRLSFQTDLPVFRLPRKAVRLTSLRTRRAKLRYVTAAEPIEPVPVRCIQVEREDGMFLAGRECIPTHNSLVIRQIAVAAAAGLHPFKNEFIPRMKVLYVDCENSDRQGRKHFRKLERVARMKHHRVPDGGLYPIHCPAGIDLSRAEDAAWLMERVTAHKPDLLVCGPFYKLHAADSEEERGARKVVAVLDAVRVQADCALIIEHHTPHGANGQRTVRPFGSSLLMRWPEMGMGIMPNSEDWPCKNVAVKPWRGNRDERFWPRALRWSENEDNWPWIIDREVGEQPR